MKRFLTILLSALMLFSVISGPALAGQAAPSTGQVKGGALHLRERPDQNARSLGRFKSGTQVELLFTSGEYFKVRTQTGQVGYMVRDFLEVEGPLPQEEPVPPEPTILPDRTRENALARGIDPNKPMLALTFDDGPQPASLKVLEALNQVGAKGTFFILGKNIAGNEEILKQIADSGHQLGSHSWSHPHLNNISQSAVRSQILRTMDKVYEITGQQVTIMRPPFGESNRLSRRPIAELGLPLILWSVDSLDWKTRNARQTASAIRAGAANGAIILCHDVWESTGAALQIVLPQLVEAGYQLVTVAEMMSFREEPLKPGWEYSFLDPEKIDKTIKLPSSPSELTEPTPKPQPGAILVP